MPLWADCERVEWTEDIKQQKNKQIRRIQNNGLESLTLHRVYIASAPIAETTRTTRAEAITAPDATTTKQRRIHDVNMIKPILTYQKSGFLWF